MTTEQQSPLNRREILLKEINTIQAQINPLTAGFLYNYSYKNKPLLLKIIKKILAKPQRSRLRTEICFVQDLVKANPLFERLQEIYGLQIIESLCSSMKYSKLSSPQPLTDICLLLEGQIIIQGKIIAVPGSCFGNGWNPVRRRKGGFVWEEEAGFREIEGDVVVQGECEVVAISNENYESILSVMNQKKYRKDLQFLQSNQLLHNQLHNEIAAYFSFMEFKQTELNEIVYKQGEDIQYLYFIFQGEFVIEKKFECNQKLIIKEPIQCSKIFSRPIQIALLSQGEIFGDENILEAKKRQYNVRCASVKGELYYISIKDFFEKFNEFSHGRILKDYIREKSERYKQRFETAIEQKELIVKSANKWVEGNNNDFGQNQKKQRKKRNSVRKKIFNENVFELQVDNNNNNHNNVNKILNTNSNNLNTNNNSSRTYNKNNNLLRLNKNEVNKQSASLLTRQYSIRSINSKQQGKQFDNQNYSVFRSIDKSLKNTKENCLPIIKTKDEKPKSSPQKILKNLFDHLNQQPVDIQYYFNQKKYVFNQPENTFHKEKFKNYLLSKR